MKINNPSEISLTIDYFQGTHIKNRQWTLYSKSNELLESFDLSRGRILFLRFADSRLIKKGSIWAGIEQPLIEIKIFAWILADVRIIEVDQKVLICEWILQSFWNLFFVRFK